MKKVIVILLVLVIGAIAALAVFLATFDLNRYNKAIASQIEAIVGNPVEIGRISLKWNSGILLGIEKFQILVEENGQRVPELFFDHGDMSLEFLPLLRMQLKVSSISVTRLNMHLVRAKDGAIKVRGYSPKTTAKAVAAKPSAIPAVINFSVGSIAVQNSAVRFEDFTMEPPSDIVIDSLDADIKNVSLDKPVQFVVKMALLSAKQNLGISGVAGGFTAAPLYIKDLNGEIDLGTIDHAKLVHAIPAAQNAGIREGPSGLLKAKVSELRLANNKIEKLSALVELNDGKIVLSQLNVPVENINLSASAENDKISIRSFSARLANATLNSSADISNLFAVPQTAMRLNAEIPAVKDFLSSVAGGRQYLDGKTTFSFEGTMSGASQESISKTLSGKGTFTLDDGVVVDTNIVKQSLGALAMFPGLVDNMTAYLPPAMKDALGRQYTVLKPIRQSFVIKDGNIALPDLKLETDFAQVIGAANLTLKGELSGKGNIIFSKELSDGMMKVFSQMSYLANQNKEVEFPITFNASGAGVSVMPDLQYIGTKVAVQKGQEMVTDLLKKAMEPKGQPQASQPSAESKPPSSFSDIMKDVKAMAGEMQDTSGGASQ